MHKGRLQFPDVRNIPIKKCHTNDTLDHVIRFKTIGLFEIILSQFMDKGVEGLLKMTEQHVDYLKKLDSPNDFVPALIDTVERQTIEMLKKKKYVEKWGEHQLRHLIRSLFM